MHGYCMNGSPACSAPGRMQETRAASFVSTSEDILIRTAAHAPANDALLHGAVRLCRVCRAETSNDRLCDTCLAAGIEIRACERCGQTFTAFTHQDVLCLECLEGDARCEERADVLEERCRIHRVRYVDDLPVSAIEEMQAEWGRW